MPAVASSGYQHPPTAKLRSARRPPPHLLTHQTAVLDNLEAVLKAHGSGLEHTVKALIFVSLCPAVDGPRSLGMWQSRQDDWPAPSTPHPLTRPDHRLRKL